MEGIHEYLNFLVEDIYRKPLDELNREQRYTTFLCILTRRKPEQLDSDVVNELKGVLLDNI